MSPEGGKILLEAAADRCTRKGENGWMKEGGGGGGLAEKGEDFRSVVGAFTSRATHRPVLKGLSVTQGNGQGTSIPRKLKGHTFP